jgi:tRNA(Ile)-lysidine synthase
VAEGPATKRVLGRVRREAKRWLPPGGHLVVALSGGGDSMALWFVLHRLAPEFGWRLYPVHVDHRLRPESSHQAAWLKAWMRERFAASLTVVSVTVAPHAGESLEQAARRVRHAALEGERRRLPSPSAVAFGHQRDDQAETVLMRVLTGTGVEGLAAIRNREGRLYPLLGCAREELRQLLREQGLPWIEDPTNRDPRWLRNRLRQQVLPFLEQTTNPRVAAALAGLAERAAEVMDYLEGEVDTWMASGVAAEADGFVVAATFAELHPALQAVVINRLGRLVGLRLSARQVQQARRRNTDLGGGWRVEHRPDGGLRWRRAAP